MTSKFAASTVRDTRSTRGSILSHTGSSDAVIFSTCSSVGSSCFCTLVIVSRVLRTVMTSSMTNHIKTMPTSTYITGKATFITLKKSIRASFVSKP